MNVIIYLEKPTVHLEMMIFFETIHEHALSIDFAMFVVIWIVQIIIYPSFRYISEDDFLQWHGKYCNQIAVFVLPLMVTQVLECLTSCFFVGDTASWVRLIGVILAWVVTFFHSARKHQYLSVEGKKIAVIKSLMGGNWIRTFLWSLVFITSVISY